MNWRNHPAFWAALGVVVTIVLAVGVVFALRQTGEANAVSDNAPLIAAVIALGGVGTTQMVSIALDGQRIREARQVEDRRVEETRALEDARTNEARRLEAQRAHEAALQNYFEDVGELLIEKPLLRASPGDNLSTVVRALTLSVLEDLDPDRKQILLRFLYEAGLIRKDKPVVSIEAANLRGANLSGAQLYEANLSGAILRGANLESVNLGGANLHGANLGEAILRGAIFLRATLEEAIFRDADLREAKLRGANLYGAILRDADLRDADLRGAKLQATNLRGADFRGADLTRADLRDADYQKADLEGAKSLRGVTMHDGSVQT